MLLVLARENTDEPKDNGSTEHDDRASVSGDLSQRSQVGDETNDHLRSNLEGGGEASDHSD
jgi:hypothetical protein